jgi:hypothetical protein
VAVVNSEVKLTVTAPESINVLDETVTYTVSASGMVDTATMMLDITLPAELLSDYEVTCLNGWFVIVKTVETGRMIVTLGNNNGVTGEGDILTITAKSAKQAGNAAVTIKYAEAAAYLGEDTETFVKVDLTEASATVEVKRNRFDVNMDGTVNMLDLTRVQKWYGTKDVICDVDGSGEVDVTDMILILNHYSDIF